MKYKTRLFHFTEEEELMIVHAMRMSKKFMQTCGIPQQPTLNKNQNNNGKESQKTC